MALAGLPMAEGLPLRAQGRRCRFGKCQCHRLLRRAMRVGSAVGVDCKATQARPR
jgi:hypothetical protein